MSNDQVASCYPTECAAFPQHLVDLLSNHYAILNPDLRKTMVQALVLMRNKDLISPTRYSISDDGAEISETYSY